MKGCFDMKKISNEIISKVLNENSADIVKTAEELEKMLDEELSKPEKEIDFELVHQLSIAVNETTGKETSDIDVNQKLIEFKAMQTNQTKHFHIPKWCTGLIAACLILVCGNAYTVKAWNMNIFSFVVEFTDGGAKIDFDKETEEIILPTSEDDPYGIIAKCQEVGITIETPHYIPDGFILAGVWAEYTDDYKYAIFRFENNNSSISFTFDSYSENQQLGIPSDEHNISEKIVNGHTAAVSKEDNQMLVVFPTGEYLFTMFAKDVDYGECEKILKSIN